MKRINKFSQFLFLKRLMLLIALVTFFYACDDKTDDKASKTESSSAACFFPTKLYQLELDSAQYKGLKEAFPGNAAKKMVVQFYFTNANPSSLTLLAFASKPGSIFEVTPGNATSKVMKITTENPVTIPDEIVLGDEEVSLKEIDDNVIKGKTDFILIFRPIVVGNRVKYKICLKGTACPAAEVITQPSPPANAGK